MRKVNKEGIPESHGDSDWEMTMHWLFAQCPILGRDPFKNLHLIFIYLKIHTYYWLWRTPVPANGVSLGWKWNLSNNYSLFLSVPQYLGSKYLLKELNALPEAPDLKQPIQLWSWPQ